MSNEKKKHRLNDHQIITFDHLEYIRIKLILNLICYYLIKIKHTIIKNKYQQNVQFEILFGFEIKFGDPKQCC